MGGPEVAGVRSKPTTVALKLPEGINRVSLSPLHDQIIAKAVGAFGAEPTRAPTYLQITAPEFRRELVSGTALRLAYQRDDSTLIVTNSLAETKNYFRVLTDPQKYGLDPELVGMLDPEVKTDKARELSRLVNRPVILLTYNQVREYFHRQLGTIDRFNVVMIDSPPRYHPGKHWNHLREVIDSKICQLWLNCEAHNPWSDLVADGPPLHSTSYLDDLHAERASSFRPLVVTVPKPAGIFVPASPVADYGTVNNRTLARSPERVTAALYLFATYRDSITGHRLLDHKSFFVVEELSHAKELVPRLNRMFRDEHFAFAPPHHPTSDTRRDVLNAGYRVVVGTVDDICALALPGFTGLLTLSERRNSGHMRRLLDCVTSYDQENPNRTAIGVSFVSTSLEDSSRLTQIVGGYDLVSKPGQSQFDLPHPYQGALPNLPPELTLEPNVWIHDTGRECASSRLVPE